MLYLSPLGAILCVQQEGIMSNEIIDMHIHFGAPSDPNDPNGCYWSKEFERTVTYFALRLITRTLFTRVTIDKAKEHMLDAIYGSKYIQKGVLLGLDQVYDEDGTPRKDLTHLYVANNYLASLSAENPRVLFGASVNPYRKDWETELDSCVKNGAVLLKWLPSAQNIDPSHPACIPFFRKLAEYRLPLLCHSGPEYSIPPFDEERQKLNHPNLLRNALDAGATVIAAHLALPLFITDTTVYLDELIALFAEADSKGWKLYADISALLFPNRSMVAREYWEKLPQQRLIMGSDYPIPMSDFTVTQRSSILKRIEIFFKTIFMKNPLDKNYVLLKDMGFNDAVFTQASELFAGIKRSL
jgi:predicted TIM-barrel fold metal-dependent hydrolase